MYQREDSGATSCPRSRSYPSIMVLRTFAGALARSLQMHEFQQGSPYCCLSYGSITQQFQLWSMILVFLKHI